MTSYATHGTDVTSRSHMIGSMDDFDALEGARILNDHYNREKYVSCRAMYLGNLYPNARLDIFKIARADAAEVFGSTSQDLSVQEIERREKEFEIEPLLPLPTTANTQTLDDFQSFPADEWSISASSPVPLSRINESPPPEVNFGSSAAISRVATGSSLQSSTHGEKPPTSPNFAQDPGAYSRLESRNEAAGHSANTTMAFNGLQQTMPANLSDMSSSPLQDSSFSSSVAIDPALTAATSPMSAQENSDAMQLDIQQTQSQPNQDLAKRIVELLGTEKAKQATGYHAWEAAADAAKAIAPYAAPQLPQDESASAINEPNIVERSPSAPPTRLGNSGNLYSTGVSSLVRRGMFLPVKPQKRTRSESPERSESTEGDENGDDAVVAEQQPPTKKRRVVLKVSSPAKKTTSALSKPSKKKTMQSQVPATTIAPLKPSTKKNTMQAQAPATRAAPSRPIRKREPSRKAAANSLAVEITGIEGVITGDLFPGTKAEAKAAAEARIGRLVANHNAGLKSRKRRQVKEGEEPDIMPEHFYVRNFDKGDQTVRCGCGVLKDDKLDMIQCDTCDVWQHMACMGIDKNKVPQQYDCHVCDPWVHREFVARLRKDNVLS